MPTSKPLSDLQRYAENMVEKHGTPAVSIAVWHNGQLHRAAAGSLNLSTGIEATTDSIFQIASVTKVFTASLVMQLVDAGSVELDAPVKHYVRDFQVADPTATKEITVRQLLNHTNGIAGDFFPDDRFGMGNPIARYVDRCNLLPQIHPPGQGFSYSNAAYAIAGRLIEVMLGITWFEAIDERIFKPLGMKESISDPKEILRFRAAMGHFPLSKTGAGEQSTKYTLAPSCYGSSMGISPAGFLAMSAPDLIKFARAHLNEGRSESGEQWLAAQSVRQMQSPQVKLPAHSPFNVTDWGLGWFLINGSSTPIIGHDGGTSSGQGAMLRLFPEQNSAFAIQQNCLDLKIFEDICNDLFSEVAGITFQEAEPIDGIKNLQRFVGRFKNVWGFYDVTLERGQLALTILGTNTSLPAMKLRLKPIEENCFAAYLETGERERNITFLDLDTEGVPESLFANCRLCSRVR